MKKYVAVIAWMLVAIMSVSFFAVSAAGFSDVQGHWAEKYIVWAADLKWIAGYPDGTFKPNGNITNAEFVSLINRVSGLTGDAELKYTDVTDKDWFFNDVKVGVANAYLYNVGEFAPGAPITREEVARIIGTIYKKSADLTELNRFTDNNKIKADAKEYVAALAKLGIINGYPQGDFKPQNPITRAEITVILYKMFAEHGDIFNATAISNGLTPDKKQMLIDAYVGGTTTDKIIPGPIPHPNPTPNEGDTPTPPTPQDDMPKGVRKAYWKKNENIPQLFGEVGHFMVKLEDVVNNVKVKKFSIVLNNGDESNVMAISDYTDGPAKYNDKVTVKLYDASGKLMKEFKDVPVEKVNDELPPQPPVPQAEVSVTFVKDNVSINLGGKLSVEVNGDLEYTHFIMEWNNADGSHFTSSKTAKADKVPAFVKPDKVKVTLYNGESKLEPVYENIIVK